MEIKETIKYRILLEMDGKVEDIVNKYIPNASFYLGKSIICDTEGLAIEYVKHIADNIISDKICLKNHLIDRVVNTLSKKADDFTTHFNVNWSGLKGNKYMFDIRSEYFDGNCFQSLLSIEIRPHYVTMVVE